MEQFKNYLIERKYRESTINGHLQNIGYFLQWIEATGMYEAENVSYNDLLSYVQYEQQRTLSVQSINIRLQSISKYFEFLKTDNSAISNPAAILRIKGKAKTVTENPLKYEELESLYHNYADLKKISSNQKQSDLSHQRNIIITGLLIWQGLHSGELERLMVEHINLSEGTIYIPGLARSNSRKLKLNSKQILTLYSYLHGGTRDKLKPKGDELLPGNVRGIAVFLLKELQGINPQIKNAMHIRASVILHWLRQHNKRQVQYMAGHRYIDSTERYQVQELTTLTDRLTKHHPFG